MNKKAVLEGLLFIVGDEGLTLEAIGETLNIDKESSEKLINELKEEYKKETRGIKINYLGNTYKLTTKSEHKEYYSKLVESNESNLLSQAALETLAIIAYNEPLTRIKVDEIRGVNSSQMIRKLVAKDLIKEVGRADTPGRPIIYSTTNEFLDFFGLSSIEELPTIDELDIDETEEKDLFLSRYSEQNEEEN